MKSLNKKMIIALCSIAGLIVLYIAAVYAFVFVPSFTRYAPNEEQNRNYFSTEENFNNYLKEKDWFEKQNPQKISIKSYDGLTLAGFNLPADSSKEANGTMILMHGYHSEPIREYTVLTHFYHDLGYNVVLPYQRTHGESEGKYITFGVRERFDLKDWILKVNEIYGNDSPVFVQGISMGCATTVMSIGQELPDNVKGIIADCGFTSPREIIWKVLTQDKKIPTAALIMKIGDFLTKNIAGFGMEEYTTFDAIDFNKKRSEQIPILFFHGTKDDFVPIEMTDANFTRAIASIYLTKDGDNKNLSLDTNPQIDKYKYVQIKDSPHAIANLVDKEKYQSEVKQFLNRYGNTGVK